MAGRSKQASKTLPLIKPRHSEALMGVVEPLRKVRGLEIVQTNGDLTVSLLGRTLAFLSEDARGPVIRYYDQSWRFTRDPSTLHRLIRSHRRKVKRRLV